MAQRPDFSDNRQSIWSFMDQIIVECPRCHNPALVMSSLTSQVAQQWRFSCRHCGRSAHCDTCSQELNSPNDPAFGLALWLTAPCCGEMLWAYNFEHLSHIEAFVGASLRVSTRDPVSGWSNRSLASRYPRWMTLGSNRDAILTRCNVLRARSISL